MDAIQQFINYRQGRRLRPHHLFARTSSTGCRSRSTRNPSRSREPFIQPNNPKLDPPSMGRHGLPDELWGITYIGKALLGAAELLAERPTGDRMIILMTDGESSDIMPPLDAANHRAPAGARTSPSSASCSPTKRSSPRSSASRARPAARSSTPSPPRRSRRSSSASTR